MSVCCGEVGCRWGGEVDYRWGGEVGYRWGGEVGCRWGGEVGKGAGWGGRLGSELGRWVEDQGREKDGGGDVGEAGAELRKGKQSGRK